eukprot:TRINITY_DN15347_c0_g1_i1.p1 TRINITY_DN15347_c0_g1~~TRINITY_DN15347_c0_g1_i1.p1  ORF type:complete len:547 (-),score=128.74 TRINITY_DN15347_c0_g1_i1:75-1715(-)
MAAPLVFFALFCLVQGASWTQRSFVESERPHPLPYGWLDTGLAAEDVMVPLTFVLNVRQPNLLLNKALEVSDPDSKFYANYASLDNIIAEFAPDQKTINLVKSWLVKHGVDAENIEVTPTRDFVRVKVPVATANKMFDITLRQFKHAEHGTVVRTVGPYSLPTPLAKVVSFVAGLVRFPAKGQIKSIERQAEKRQSDVIVDPKFVWKSFGTEGIKSTNNNNSQAVAQFLAQYYAPDDLTAFETKYVLPKQHVTVVGTNDITNPGMEATLDIEYITATGLNVPTWFWSTSGEHEGQERFVDWAQGLNKRETIPWVHSISYGDDESTITSTYKDRLDQEFQKLALRGITLLFASGDNGVGCKDTCTNLPNWPASSTFVTAVGGFDGSFNGDTISSGGFSNYFSQPDWQKQAVANYLKNEPHLPPSTQYNVTGRAIPDVSAFSENVEVYCGGSWTFVGGTSCAAPTFAGVVSLINDALLSAGKKPVGSMNPALYKIGASTPKAFVDITSGNNQNGCCKGFDAAQGWDPQTGWGGPNFPVLKSAFLALQK